MTNKEEITNYAPGTADVPAHFYEAKTEEQLAEWEKAKNSEMKASLFAMSLNDGSYRENCKKWGIKLDGETGL